MESGATVAASAISAQARLVSSLRSKIPVNAIVGIGNPYLTWQGKSPPAAAAGTVCAVQFEADQVHYRLATFLSTALARRAGAKVTHYGRCGTCSTLQDLAVYIEKPDLTAPVRRCAIGFDENASLKCLETLGFSAPCAQTWWYDAQNTRQQCFVTCMMSWILGSPPRDSDGHLNDCLQCDEDHSGPVFKATAGRTRRNSGIRSSIPRGREEIAPVVHDYVPELARP